MRLKWLFGVVALLAVLGAITLYTILSRYDLANLKPHIANAVKNATGRELILAGDLKLKVGLRPVLVLEDCRFQNAAWGSRPDMITVSRLEIQLALMPLLRGDIDLKRLILVEPDILIEMDKTGLSNFPGDVAEKRGQPKPQTGEAVPPSLIVFFDEVVIEKGILVFKDARSGTAYRLRLDTLTSSARPDGLAHMKMHGAYNEIPFEIKGAVGTFASAVDASVPWAVDLTARSGDTTVTAEGTVKDLLAGKGIDLFVTAKGHSVPRLLALFGVSDIPEVGPFQVAGRLTNPDGKLTGKGVDIQIGEKALAKVRAMGDVDDFLTLTGINVEVHGSGESLPGLFEIFGIAQAPPFNPFQVSGHLSNRDGTYTVRNLDLTAGSESLAEIHLSGTVGNLLALEGMDLDFAVHGSDLATVEGLVQQPLFATGAFSVTGHAQIPTQGTYKVSGLRLLVEGTDVSGDGQWVSAGDRPNLTASLSCQSLDLRPFLSGKTREEEAVAAEDSPGKARVFPQTPLPLGRLGSLDAQVTLEAKAAALPLFAFQDVAARMSLRDGHLTVDPFQAVVGKGTMSARLEMRPLEKGFVVDLFADGKDLAAGQILKDLEISDALEGNLDIHTDLRGHGESVGGLLGTLSGRTVLVIKEGRMHDRLIRLWGGHVGSTLLQVLKPSKQEDRYLDIHCLVSGLVITDGLAETTALVLDTSEATLVGHGKLNLKTETIDLDVKSTPKKGVGVKGLGSLSLSLGELTKPMKLSGTLANPVIAIDPAGTIFTIGKAVGGIVLFGPVGLAAALASGSLGNRDPCEVALAAIETSRTDSAGAKGGKAERAMETPNR